MISRYFIIPGIIFFACAIIADGNAATQPAVSSDEVRDVQGSADIYGLRTTRHMLLVSSIPKERKDKAIHILDVTIAAQLKLIDEVRGTPSRHEDLARRAGENAKQANDEVDRIFTDDDDAAIADATRLATFEERIFYATNIEGPDRFLEILEKLDLTPEQKKVAIQIRVDSRAECVAMEDDWWHGLPRSQRGAFEQPRNKLVHQRQGIAAVAAEKFRAILKPAQLKKWVAELSGSKR